MQSFFIRFFDCIYTCVAIAKNAFLPKIYSNSDSGKSSVGRAKTLSECLLAHFSCEKYTTKKVSEKSETFTLRTENESLSICSLLCISSNYLCPVLYSQFEGHLGCFKVSFESDFCYTNFRTTVAYDKFTNNF